MLKQQGRFRHEHPNPNSVIGATKWCVFEKDKDEEITAFQVVQSVQERMNRMQTSRVDHLQVVRLTKLSFCCVSNFFAVSLAGLLEQ